ncbi:MAG: acylphosphatase [Candidatus Methanoperedens sp.]|nr:acylphosphatase [Candidatus Methanoperedens sp.]
MEEPVRGWEGGGEDRESNQKKKYNESIIFIYYDITMNTLMQKCHSIIVTGKVQDIGFRSVVEHIGRSFGMPGLVFNAKDGSVKILCCGEDSVIDNFMQTIKVRGEESGAEIEGIKEQALPIDIDLQDEFSRVSSDDEIDIGRKLDKGNYLLTDIKTDTSGIRTDTSLLTEIRTDTSILPEINDGINNLNIRFDAFSSRLEKILEKLIER